MQGKQRGRDLHLGGLGVREVLHLREAALRGLVVGVVGLAWLTGCGGEESDGSEGVSQRALPPPDIVWVVWDTCRVDHLSVYGYERPTTPFLQTWAKQARVFTDCVSAGSTTVPAHASMFTGLLQPEHGAQNRYAQLQERFDTIAELLKRAGYATYLFSCNPHIDAENGFAQGFDVAEHPWSPAWRQAALDLLRRKVNPKDRSHNLLRQIRKPKDNEWPLSHAGELVTQAVEKWLQAQPKDQRVFIFLNYMEAHTPLIPPRPYRERFMSAEQVQRSYRVDRTFGRVWSYVFGLEDYTPEQIDLTRRTYDAALRHLDDMFAELIRTLEAWGRLENAVVVFTSDHGEHLGEHHMLDHQFSVYNELLYVPLIVRYPPAFEPGREARPVMNMDLFVTLLHLAGVQVPAEAARRGRDLRDPAGPRDRLAVYPAPPDWTFRLVRSRHRDFDPTPFKRSLWAFYAGGHKLIWSSDGRHELYDVVADRAEQNNLLTVRPTLAQQMCARLESYVASLNIAEQREALRERSEESLRRLEALGYAGGGDADAEETALPTCNLSSDDNAKP